MELTGERKQYLDNLVNELLNDKEWELPEEDRACLKQSLAWNLAFL